MALLGYGIDVVDVTRFERVWRRFGDRLLERLFSVAEREYCLKRPSPAAHLAARFGAKEAFIKAMGTRTGFRWRDIEVASEGSGRPYFIFHARAIEGVEKKGIAKAFLSLAHDANVSIAGVILESR